MQSAVPAMTEVELRGVVEAWIADDPGPGDRVELQALLERAFASAADSRALAELRDRFAGRLTFGTAGLRGAVGAGPNRMNRAVVRAATAAVAGWLLGSVGNGAAGGGAPSKCLAVRPKKTRASPPAAASVSMSEYPSASSKAAFA